MWRWLVVCGGFVGALAFASCGGPTSATDAGALDAGAPDAGPGCVRDGGLLLRYNQDWADFLRTGCTSITGQLSIAAGLVVLSPPATALTAVGGLYVADNSTLTSLSLPALTTVSENVRVSSNTALTSLELPALTTVGGGLLVQYNTALTSLHLPALQTCGGLAASTPLDVHGNAALTSLSLPALTTASGGLAIATNATLADLGLPALVTLRGSLSVTDNTMLRQCLVDAIKLRITTGPFIYTSSGNNGMPNTCP